MWKHETDDGDVTDGILALESDCVGDFDELVDAEDVPGATEPSTSALPFMTRGERFLSLRLCFGNPRRCDFTVLSAATR